MGQKVGQDKLYIKCIKNIKFGKAAIKKKITSIRTNLDIRCRRLIKY